MDTVIVATSQFYSHYPKRIPKGTVNAEAVLIRLDSEWDNLTVRIHWLNVESGVEKVVLLERDQPNTIPWEVLDDMSELRMGLDGMDGGTIVKPTVWLTYGYVVDGVDPEAGDDPQPPTPSWEQQMVEQATQASQSAQAAQKAAEDAAESAASAGPYAEQAKKSAEAAKVSQDAAATSAQQANEAAQTAQNAAGSIGDAVKRAEDAATAAGTAQQAAEAAQGAAARSAETAHGAATTANQAAQESNSAATKAGQYLTSVESAAKAAASARDQATTAATTAKGAAQAAASARDQATTAATTAQDHATAASTAKDAAEQAAATAGSAQSGAAQSAQTAANSAKEAETAKQEAQKSASIFPKITPEDAGKVLMVSENGEKIVTGDVSGGGKIDDTTLGRDTTWSSRMIVDSLAPYFETSGPVVTCNPVSGYPLSVVSQIVAVQSGSGDPSPENVRPISGWDTISTRITGMNVWDNNADSAIVEEYPSGNGYLAFPLKLKPNANYTLYIPKNTRGSSNITLTTEERQNNSPKDEFYINLSGTELFIEGYKKIRTGETGYVFINVSSRTKDQFWKGLRETVPQLMIYEGADEIPYEPYAGKTVTSQLGQTIYGGTLNWMTGELTVTHICADIKSADAWGNSDAVNGYILNKDFGISEGGAVLCNIAPVSFSGGAGSLTASVAYGYVRMSDFKNLFPTIEEWRGFLDEIGGVQVCGKLKTPTTVKLTPTEILALTDTNTLYTDTGDITVSGRADPNEVIKGLEDRIAALQGRGGGTMDAQQVLFSRALAATCTTFTDTQSLAMPDILPTWQEFLDSGREIPSGVCLMHEHQCYRQAQSAPIKPEAQRPPGSPGMSAVYRPVVSGHAGTLDDPIPWVYEMDCKEGKYYSHKGKIYLCTGDMSPCVWEPGGGAPQWEVVA